MDNALRRSLPAFDAAVPDAAPTACGLPLPPATDRVLRLHGWVKAEVAIRPEDLVAFAAQPLDGFRVVCTFGGDHGGDRPMRTVPLRDLLALVEPDFDVPTDFKRTAIVAEGRDGYRALFSWIEVFNTPNGDGLHVAFDDPARPLPDDTGPFALVSLQDRVTGPRFVRGLRAIELKAVW